MSCGSAPTANGFPEEREGLGKAAYEVHKLKVHSPFYRLVGRGYPFKHFQIKQRPRSLYYVGIWSLIFAEAGKEFA